MPQRIQTCSLFRLSDNWESHVRTFEEYKLKGIQPEIYGRDASLSYPDVHHIHLAQDRETIVRWANSRITCSYYRTHAVGEPDKDYWLVYAYDDLNESYLLLTIIGPDAHNDALWRSYLGSIYTQFVDPWINGRLDCAQ